MAIKDLLGTNSHRRFKSDPTTSTPPREDMEIINKYGQRRSQNPWDVIRHTRPGSASRKVSQWDLEHTPHSQSSGSKYSSQNQRTPTPAPSQQLRIRSSVLIQPDPFNATNRPPHEFWNALELLELVSIAALETRFLATDEFLIPWTIFRDYFLLVQENGMPRMSLPGRITRERVLAWYTLFDEGQYRKDPYEDSDSDEHPTQVYNTTVYKTKGTVDKSSWTVDEHEKHLYAHLLQTFRVGRGKNPHGFKYFQHRNICVAYEQIFAPIVHVLIDQYDIRGRQYYGRLALFIEKKKPSALAFPEANVAKPFHHVSTATRIVSQEEKKKAKERHRTHKTVLEYKKKVYEEDEKELRTTFAKYGALVEKPKVDLGTWLSEQRTLAAHNQARLALEGFDKPLRTAGLGPDIDGPYEPMLAKPGLWESPTAYTTGKIVTPKGPHRNAERDTPIISPSSSQKKANLNKRLPPINKPLPPFPEHADTTTVSQVIDDATMQTAPSRQFSTVSDYYADSEAYNKFQHRSEAIHSMEQAKDSTGPPQPPPRHPAHTVFRDISGRLKTVRPISKENIRAALEPSDSSSSSPSPVDHAKCHRSAAFDLDQHVSLRSMSTSPPPKNYSGVFTHPGNADSAPTLTPPNHPFNKPGIKRERSPRPLDLTQAANTHLFHKAKAVGPIPETIPTSQANLDPKPTFPAQEPILPAAVFTPENSSSRNASSSSAISRKTSDPEKRSQKFKEWENVVQRKRSAKLVRTKSPAIPESRIPVSKNRASAAGTGSRNASAESQNSGRTSQIPVPVVKKGRKGEEEHEMASL